MKKTVLHEPKHRAPKVPAFRIAKRGDLYSVEVKVGTVWVPVEQSDSLARAEDMHVKLSAPAEVVG